MRLLCDEGVDQQIVEKLRSQEHDVTYIAEVAPGASDDDVFTRANEMGAILLTTDKDFGELVFRQRRIPHGVLLIRLAGLSQRRKATTVASAVQQFGDELAGARLRPSGQPLALRSRPPQTAKR